METISYSEINFSAIIESAESSKGNLLKHLYEKRKNKLQLKQKNIPEKHGIYIFWWKGDLNCFEEKSYRLKGPGGIEKNILINKDWVAQATKNNAVCLYIGKSSGLRTRISKHVKISTQGRLFKKDDPMLRKTNTESQLRYGLERIFPNEKDTLNLLLDNVELAIVNLPETTTGVDRFYLENYLIGNLKPLLNLDIER